MNVGENKALISQALSFLDKTCALKVGMMQELLTGRIRLPIPETLKKA